jgi:hypothetical protein
MTRGVYRSGGCGKWIFLARAPNLLRMGCIPSWKGLSLPGRRIVQRKKLRNDQKKQGCGNLESTGGRLFASERRRPPLNRGRFDE